MDVIKGFCDLSIPDVQSEEYLISTLSTLVKLGYSTAAINYTLDESIFYERVKKKKQKKKEGEAEAEADTESADIVPEPKSIDHLKKEFKDTLKIFQRVTINIGNKGQAHKLSQSQNLMKYNIVAVIPTTELLLNFACSEMKIDLISFNPGIKPYMKVKRNMYNMAVERGIFFELMYAPAILDSSNRKNIIYMGHMYHTFGNSKNIVITSDAMNSFQVRGPYDIINLGLLFGLSEEQAKCALTSTSRSLILTAAGRTYGQAVVQVTVKKGARNASKSCKEEADSQDFKGMGLDYNTSDLGVETMDDE